MTFRTLTLLVVGSRFLIFVFQNITYFESKTLESPVLIVTRCLEFSHITLNYTAISKIFYHKSLHPTCFRRAEYGLGVAPPPGRKSRREGAGVAGQANRHSFSHLHVGPRPVLQRRRNWGIEGDMKCQHCGCVSARYLDGKSHHHIIMGVSLENRLHDSFHHIILAVSLRDRKLCETATERSETIVIY